MLQMGEEDPAETEEELELDDPKIFSMFLTVSIDPVGTV
jgi:hypothetical protein